jgi:hypothetical protein
MHRFSSVSMAQPRRKGPLRWPSTKRRVAVYHCWRFRLGATWASFLSSAWTGGLTATKVQSCWVNDWPAGKNATRTWKCADDWSATSRTAGWSTSPRMLNLWSLEAMAAAGTLGCIWVRSLPRSCGPRAFRSLLFATVAMALPTMSGYDAFGVGSNQSSERSKLHPGRTGNGRRAPRSSVGRHRRNRYAARRRNAQVPATPLRPRDCLRAQRCQLPAERRSDYHHRAQ